MIMDERIKDEIIQKTTECHHNFKCLTDDKHPLCAVEGQPIIGVGVFVTCKSSDYCSYRLSFGAGHICNCPTRCEIFLKYNR